MTKDRQTFMYFHSSLVLTGRYTSDIGKAGYYPNRNMKFRN